MDICWTRASAYEAANRNKGPFVRPVTTSSAASVNHPFSKVAGVHAQVSRWGAVLYTRVLLQMIWVGNVTCAVLLVCSREA